MFNHSIYENSRPDGMGVLEVNDDSTSSKQPRLFVPLVRTELAGEIAGPLAWLRLTQVFRYSREQCDHTLEALYRFPLPGDAAVTGVTVRFGDVEIRAELKEREQAEAEYDRAKQEGRSAALTTRESPDVFTLQVAGLQPDQEIRVETTYVQLARVEGLDWTLRVPLTTSPRYVRQDEVGSRHAAGQPLLLLRDPGHRFQLDLLLQGAGAVQSPTHRLEVTPGDDGLRARLQEGEVIPDRDCLLRWRPPLEEARPGLRLLLHHEAGADQVYFLALVTPPARPGRRVPREVVLLVDHSGSMEGAKWDAADWAVKQFLAGLGPDDRFALGLFHDTTRWFRRESCSATPENVSAAVRFLEKTRDSGGTELGTALEQALDLSRAVAGEVARHVLIVTDAEVTDRSRLFSMAEREAGRNDARRISVLCIDSAPNALLATELAERGGGVARFLTSSPQEEDITTALEAVLEDWSAPVLTGLRLEVDRPRAESGSHTAAQGEKAGWSAMKLGDLPSGRAVWVSGRVAARPAEDLNFRLVTAAGEEISTRRPRVGGPGYPALKSLFGARRLLGLERLLIEHEHDAVLPPMKAREELAGRLRALGYDPEPVLGPPARWGMEPVRNPLRSLLVREALGYGLACQETAFIAQRWEAGKRVEGTVAVANGLPQGWSEDFLGGGGVLYCMAPSPSSMPRATLHRHSRVSYRRSASPSPGFVDAMQSTRSPSDEEETAAPGFSLVEGDDQEILAWASEMLDEDAEPETPSNTSLFSGSLAVTGPEAVLFDSSEEESRLPGAASFSSLTVRFPDGASDLANLDPGLCLLLYIGDLAAPRMRVRLADIIRQGGTRPVNLQRASGERVILTVADPNRAWLAGSPRFEVFLA